MRKQTNITIASIFFLTVVVLHLYGLFFTHSALAFYTKPFLMISLVTIYLTSTKSPSFWYVSALFFSFWGDVLLLFKASLFVYGLGSFLLAHVLFIKITVGFIPKFSPKKVLISLKQVNVCFLLKNHLLLGNQIRHKQFPRHQCGLKVGRNSKAKHQFL